MLNQRFLITLAVIVTAAAPASGITVLQSSAAARGGTPLPSEVGVGAYADGCGGLVPFAAWLGKSTASVYNLVYLTPKNAAQITFAIANAMCMPGQKLELSLAIGTENKIGWLDTYANMIGGGDDELYKDVAAALASYAPNAIVRPGWEMNGNWFDWGSGGAYGFTAAQYAAVFQHIVTVMRSVPGTAGLKFNWCPALCNGCVDPTALYPGDSYVDIIGIDAYERNLGDGSARGWSSYWTSCSHCLAWQVSFAQSHGKALALDEWGVGYLNHALDDVDPPFIIRKINQWLNNTSNVNGYRPYLYFVYWNTNEGYCGVISGQPDGSCPGGYAPPTHGPPYQLPNSAAAFLNAF